MTEKLKMEQNPLSATVEKIKEICPAAVTSEGKIDFEELKTALSGDVAVDAIEKYEFTWVGKNTAKAEANRPIRKTLRPVVEDSKNWDTTKNLYIEGDNLDALKLLQESYLGKVKMIYIDPPYNTGNDFVYCDEFAVGCEEYLDKKGQCDSDGNRLFKNTETNGRFHSDWCSMMYPRLKIARDLLSDDGVIFISIDDNEQANLKKICDEIFGADNFVGIFSVENNPKGRKNSKFISVSNEFCVVYCRDYAVAGFKNVIPKEASDMVQDENGDYIRNSGKRVLVGENFLNKVVSTEKSDKHYSVYFNKEQNKIEYRKESSVRDVDTGLISQGFKRYISYRDGVFVENTYTQEKFNELFITGALTIKDDKIYEKHFSDAIQIKSMLTNKKYKAIVNNIPVTYELDLKTTSAKQDLAQLIGANIFDFPKNVSYLKLLISLVASDDNTILDFFSGSATTAHAVMQLNAEDGGNRRFIMVQLPEKCEEDSEAFRAGYKNICEIGKERIRRAGEKIKSENPDKDLDIGFRVLRIDSTNMKDVYYKPSDTTQKTLLDAVDNIKSDRSDMDLLFGVMVDCGLPLNMPIETKTCDGKKYYVVNGGDYLVACFEPEISEKLVYEIANLKPTIAVFRDSSFADAKDKVNVSEIF